MAKMSDPAQSIAEAFSRKARVYDEFGTDHDNLARMREKVRKHILSFLKPGDQILELNAGTGADAAYLARLGFRVHATDLSPGMVAQIQDKIDRYELRQLLSVQECSFLHLDQISGGPFQFVLSNMGGLNCTRDLELVARGVRTLLSPGGYVTWVVMPPICLWELSRVLRGDFKTAFRRLSKGGVLANVEGVRFMTYYFTPKKVIQAFGEGFQLVSVLGLSVFTPAADAKEFPYHHPRLYRLLRSLDDRLSDRAPFNRWGDFFILTLRYSPSQDDKQRKSI